MQNTFDYLDLGQFRSLYNLQNPRRMKFYVEGIKCAKCISKIEGLKIDNEQIQTLEVDLANQTALVELKSAEYSFARIAKDIANLGFHPFPVKPSDDNNEMWRQEAKTDLIRLGVAGFCAGNIMFLAFSIYFGLNGSMRTTFEWLQFFLYLPVVSYVAWPFYKGFISGLKQRSLSIDGPMAIASFLGFTFSTWNLVKGNSSIYYDSTSSFLFLILATRFFQKKVRFEYLRFLKPSSMAETFKARLVVNQYWEWVRSDQLKPDDRIIVEQGEWVPADGILLNHGATLDLSVLCGESYPRTFQSGAKIKAGSRLLSDKIIVHVDKSGANTFLARLLSSMETSSSTETEFSRLSNKASQILMIVVLTVAACTLLYGIWGNFENQFEKAFALIVLACPCAMAFGTPLAFSFSMKNAQEKGIIIKSVKTFDDLEKIDTVFLDKTGTLTERTWRLENSSLLHSPLVYKKFILMLEAKSQHPIAFALREIWADVKIQSDIRVFSYAEEIPSLGVKGKLGHKLIKFQHFIENNEKWFGLFEDDHLLWKFQLKSALRPGSLQTIQEINKTCAIYLISGDKSSETQAIAHELNICPLTTYSDLTPEMKESLVQKKPNAIMIGDGVNDALALKTAKVGIAVSGSVDVALKSADVLFLNGGIHSLPELFQIAKKNRQQIKKNLGIAFVYNAIGGTAALMGLVNPFVAALLMPASSIYILGSTWWGTRK